MAPQRWQQIKDIFAAAEEIPPGECAAFLDQACGADPELRAEVEPLLRRRSGAHSFLDQPGLGLLRFMAEEDRETRSRQASTFHEPSDQQMAASVSTPGANMTGEKLGPYEVISRLGSGGMGIVYKARDSRLGRFVAVKVLPPTEAASEERKRRFVQEARAASALNHPNIITVHEIGWTSTQAPYIVMEYISGQALRQMLADGALALNSVLGIAVQVADGLAAAHQSGIVHRDLKPENIMLGAGGAVKILDFGLAKLVPAEANAADTAVADRDT